MATSSSGGHCWLGLGVGARRNPKACLATRRATGALALCAASLHLLNLYQVTKIVSYNPIDRHARPTDMCCLISWHRRRRRQVTRILSFERCQLKRIMHIHSSEACQYYKHSYDLCTYMFVLYIWCILYILVVSCFLPRSCWPSVSFQRTLDTCIWVSQCQGYFLVLWLYLHLPLVTLSK